MDLSAKLTPEQLDRAIGLLSYQPFILSDDIQTGAGYSWTIRDTSNTKFVCRKSTCSAEEWDRFTTYATAAASVYCILQFLLLRPISALALPLRVYELTIAMALFSTVLPLFMMAEALRRIGASRVAMISSLGPAATVTSGYLGLDERMTVLQTMGGALIVSGVLIVASHVRRQDAK